MSSPAQSPRSTSAKPSKATAAAEAEISYARDIDRFTRAVAAANTKPNSSAALAAVLTHFADRWLPELLSSSAPPSSRRFVDPSESPTAAWLKKRLLVEALVAALPPVESSGGNDVDGGGGIGCDFLLKLLRAGNMVGVDGGVMAAVEERAAKKLKTATLSDIMIPAFGHESKTLLDVGLVARLVKRWAGGGDGGNGAGGGAARVARLVDSYLAEAAVEAGLSAAAFEELAGAVPAHARSADDALYRAVDTFLKAHPSTGKEERRSLCRLIDARKLSADAAAHAIQNDRLPVRSVMQVLFSEHTKLNRLAEWSGSFTSLRSPSPAPLDHLQLQAAAGARCPSKRSDHHEMRRLRDDVARLQLQCHALQAQIDRLTPGGRRGGSTRGFFKWSSFFFKGGDVAKVDDSESGAERRSTLRGWKKADRAAAPATPSWRKSSS